RGRVVRAAPQDSWRRPRNRCATLTSERLPPRIEEKGAMPTYIVQPNDTLSEIAARFDINLGALQAANPEIQNPDQISVGQHLTTPDGSSSGSSSSGGQPGSAARDRVMGEAAKRRGIPYRLPPDGTNNLDCSLYVVVTFRAAGVPFRPEVRTAEQIRQACDP